MYRFSVLLSAGATKGLHRVGKIASLNPGAAKLKGTTATTATTRTGKFWQSLLLTPNTTRRLTTIMDEIADQQSRRVSLSNRCAESKSPYVRSHISNPTAWQLWEPATLQMAKDTNRLLFVSIGYSACHWCHVMAHESFDDPRIAQLLNENFIPVKIDREERPDIDRQYMDFQQATSGGGGWPLNVFVTPELEPIFGGTYWPGPQSERAQKGATFEDILLKVAKVWKEQEARVRENGKQIISQLRQFAQEGTLGGDANGVKGADEDGLELDILDDAYQHYKTRFDSKYAGFGGSPKFPTPVHLRALLRLSAHSPEVRGIVGEKESKHARFMAAATLSAMAKGGIKDQVGHGFARYSVTRDWSLPHFEKMLYDQAQLLPLYLEAWMLTKSPLFLETVHDVATYLTTEPILSPLGALNASEDADSRPSFQSEEKREGAFYVWTYAEVKSILDEQEFQACAKYWNVQPQGNVDRRFDAQGELVGQNTLSVSYEIGELAKSLQQSEDDLRSRISSASQKLRAFREKNRPRPDLDDKIVVAWNGLALGGLAKTAAALTTSAPAESKSYLHAAEKIVACLETHLLDPADFTLRRVYREGPGNATGFADDYAFLISGLIDLYEATFNDKYLQLADRLQQTQIQLFWDTDKYAFFSTPENQPDILIRSKDAMDNAEPSTNGVSAANLFRLGSLLNDQTYEKKARQTISAFEVEIGHHPGLFTGMMSSVVASKLGMKGLMVIGDGEAGELALKQARESVRPNVTILRVSSSSSPSPSQHEWLRQRNELLGSVDGSKEMVQLCEGGMCRVLGLKEVEGLFAAPTYEDEV